MITDFAISGKTTDTLAPDKIEVSFYKENYFLGFLLSTSLNTIFTHSLANTNNNTSLDFNFIPTVDYGKYNIKIVSLDKAGNRSSASEFNKIQYLSESSAKRLFAQDKEKLDELKDESQISLLSLEKKAKFRREKEASQLKEMLNDLNKQFGAPLNFSTIVLIYQDVSLAVSQTLSNVSSDLIVLNFQTGKSLTDSQAAVKDRIVQAQEETTAEFARIESQIKTLANGINNVLRQAQDKLSGSQTEIQKQISQDYGELIETNKNITGVVSQTAAAVSGSIGTALGNTVGAAAENAADAADALVKISRNVEVAIGNAVGSAGKTATDVAKSAENATTIVLKQILPDVAVNTIKTARLAMLALNNVHSESQDQVKESITAVQKQTDLEAARLGGAINEGTRQTGQVVVQAYTQASGLIDAAAFQVQSTAAAVSANIQKTYDNAQDATTQTVNNVVASIGSATENLNNQFTQSKEAIVQGVGNLVREAVSINKDISRNFSESQNQAKEQLAQVNKRLNEKLAQTGESLRVTLRSVIKPAEEAKNFADRVAKGAVVAFGTFQAYVFDENPTKISNVTIEGVGSDFVKISWETNHVTRNNKVNYGETLAYGQEIWGSDGGKNHKVKISGLKPGKRYFFEVMGQNKNYAYDAFYSFETLKK